MEAKLCNQRMINFHKHNQYSQQTQHQALAYKHVCTHTHTQTRADTSVLTPHGIYTQHKGLKGTDSCSCEQSCIHKQREAASIHRWRRAKQRESHTPSSCPASHCGFEAFNIQGGLPDHEGQTRWRLIVVDVAAVYPNMALSLKWSWMSTCSSVDGFRPKFLEVLECKPQLVSVCTRMAN